MKLLTTILVSAVIGTAGMAYADEFGARFSDQAPVAFGEVAHVQDEPDASALQDIMPAAGEERRSNKVRATGADAAGLVRIYPDRSPDTDLDDMPLSP